MSNKTSNNTTETTSTQGPVEISKPALIRLLHRAGVSRISNETYAQLRLAIGERLSELLQKVIAFTTHDGRKTVKIGDLRAALRINNVYLAAGLSSNTKSNLPSCNSKGKSGPVKKVNANKDATKKQHRFRPGTRAKRAIKYQQKHSDCLGIPKAVFRKLVREIAGKYQVDEHLRFSEGVFDLLQLVVENYIVTLCEDAYKITLHCKRDTIKPEDISLTLALRQNC